MSNLTKLKSQSSFGLSCMTQPSVETVKTKPYQNKHRNLPRKNNDDWNKRSLSSKPNKERQNTSQFSEDDNNGSRISKNIDVKEVTDKDDLRRSPFQKKLFYFFELPKGCAAKTFSVFSALCVVGIMICIDTLPTYALSDYRALWLCIDIIVIITFTVEYLGRFFASVNKLRFFFRPLNMIDLFSIAPFYVQIFIQGTAEACVQYQLFIYFIRRASFTFLKEGLLTNKTGPVTLTTTGYGDEVPYTSWGKFFAGVTMLCGILVIAMKTSIHGSSFVAEWTAHERAQFLAKIKRSRRLVRKSDNPHVALAWRSKLLRRRNDELLAAITEVQETLADVHPTRYYQKYKNLQAHNGDNEDNGEKSWLPNKTIYRLRYPNYSSKRVSILPFRKTLTSASTDDDTVGNGQSMNEKRSSSLPKQSKEKIKSHTPNPFKLKLLRRFSRSLHLSNNDVSKLPEGGISKSDISMPFNQRSLRPVDSADADYNDYDHPESVMTIPEGNDSNKLGRSNNLFIIG
ncbi:4510_t:CDS:2 [Paraglomus occultum]|uniref:4510_t:CDS:1 n=1 Tax=Paraglomus occultum TaxID=144539 RepID=A0A9N9CYR5_9GLOM|nr:4510_t:CDS:2 [Paraglomus occultum]